MGGEGVILMLFHLRVGGGGRCVHVVSLDLEWGLVSYFASAVGRGGTLF